MKYALLIYPKPDSFDAVSRERGRRDHGASTWPCATRPGSSTAPSSRTSHATTTVRVQDGEALTTDGPFAETKEVMAGYYMFEADDLDRALELAARIPAARMGGAVEVRPLVEVRRLRDRCLTHPGAPPSTRSSARSGAAIVAHLTGFLGDLHAAEEAAQEAFAIAAERWERDGVPAQPRAWLVATARHRAIDRIRRERVLAAKAPLLASEPHHRGPDAGLDPDRR